MYTVKEEQVIDGCAGVSDGLPTDPLDTLLNSVGSRSELVTLALGWRGVTEGSAEWRR